MDDPGSTTSDVILRLIFWDKFEHLAILEEMQDCKRLSIANDSLRQERLKKHTVTSQLP